VHAVHAEKEGANPTEGGPVSGGELPSSAISKPVPKVQLLKLRKSIVSSSHFQETGRNKASQASLIDIIDSDSLTADELLSALQQGDCSRLVAAPAVLNLLQHVREQLMTEIGDTLHSRELLIQQQAMLSAQEHYTSAIAEVREQQAQNLQELQSKLSQSYDDHVAAIAELSSARADLDFLRQEQLSMHKNHTEVVENLRKELEEARSDVEAANAFRFRVRDDANEEIKAAHRYYAINFLSSIFCNFYILVQGSFRHGASPASAAK
jgi:DNA repair exonuclease SbcCD ATPase subunit